MAPGSKQLAVTSQERTGQSENARLIRERTNVLLSHAINNYLTPHPSGAPDLNCTRLSAVPQPSETMYLADGRNQGDLRPLPFCQRQWFELCAREISRAGWSREAFSRSELLVPGLAYRNTSVAKTSAAQIAFTRLCIHPPSRPRA